MRNNILFILFPLLFFYGIKISAQNQYHPNDFDLFEDKLETLHESYLSNIQGKNAKKIKKKYKELYAGFVESVEDSAFYFNATIDFSLDNVINEIAKNNAEINAKDLTFLVKNSTIPNAACYGNGLFHLNLALFNYIESEDELAFIVAHEIAHYQLEHNKKKLTNYVNTLHSKSTKERLKNIRRKKYGVTRGVMSMMDDIGVEFINRTIQSEKEADSLGFLLLSKTKYNQSAALSALERLEIEDDVLFDHDPQLKKRFNFRKLPFKDKWLAEEKSSLFDLEDEVDDFSLRKDTLKTHPEIKERLEFLKKTFNVKSNNSDLLAQRTLADVREITLHHTIDFTIDFKFLDLSIYLLSKYRSENLISEAYFKDKLILVFETIYHARLNHELGKYVPQKNDMSDELMLNQIRLFIHNLEITEIKTIATLLCQQYNRDNGENTKCLEN
ncbi:M48 family metallopeptidase [Gangjinia marincola]|uniref:M48 family metallopeptidase n=1 Tax=Gangjinia marincola TaxID=578463 RepID=A0ABP3XXH0_9FLAO